MAEANKRGPGDDADDRMDDVGVATTTAAPNEAQPVRATTGRWITRRSWGRRAVRATAIAGVLMLVLGLSGWWLTTRVLDDDGFADVVTTSLERPAVRDYIASEITLRLAPTSKFLTAARPIATTAIAEVLDDRALTSAVHSIVTGIHHQVFELNSSSRANVSAASAAATLKAALQGIDSKLAERLPDQVYTITSSLTQNRAIELAADIAAWVRILYLPACLVGIAMLVLVLLKARDGVHATRFVGLTMAVVGAVAAGFGGITPSLSALVGGDDPDRARAIGAFLDVLLGRLVGAGLAMVGFGLLLALVPGRDGADAPTRYRRVLNRQRLALSSSAGQVFAGVAVVVFGVLLVTVPAQLAQVVLLGGGGLLVFAGLVTLVRSTGALRTTVEVARIRRRQIAGVGLAMVLCAGASTVLMVGVVDATRRTQRADPRSNGCNGSFDLCFQPIDQIVWPASHNSMSSVAYNSFAAEHTVGIPEQLNRGARALLIDAYYGYKQSGIVRTNLGGEANRQEILDEFGKDALDELNRLGALTGTIDTSGKKTDVYLCHGFCEIGSVKAAPVFKQIDDFLSRNLTDVVVLDIEDYVQPADLEKALKDGGLWDRVYTLDPSKPMPTLLDLVSPEGDADEAPRRLIVMAENNGGKADWLPDAYALAQETPYTFKTTADFNCLPNRGQPNNPLFLMNHWLREPGPPDPVGAAKINSEALLEQRITQCIDERRTLPNFLAVDFFGIGATMTVANEYNAAVALQTGVSPAIDTLIQTLNSDPTMTDADLADLDNLQRLPEISADRAAQLLGPLSGTLRTTPLIDAIIDGETYVGDSGDSPAPTTSVATTTPTRPSGPADATTPTA